MKIHARQFRRDLPCFRRDKIFDELVNGERFDEFAGMRVLHGRRDVFIQGGIPLAKLRVEFA